MVQVADHYNLKLCTFTRLGVVGHVQQRQQALEALARIRAHRPVPEPPVPCVHLRHIQQAVDSHGLLSWLC